MEPVQLQYFQGSNYSYFWIHCFFVSPCLCSLSAVQHLNKRTWLNTTQHSGGLITVRSGSDSSLSVRWNSGCSLTWLVPTKQQHRRQQFGAWEIGGARGVCQIRVHCMSLTLTAGDLAWGHVPDLGEFQVLLCTVIQLINPASWLRPLLLLLTEGKTNSNTITVN